MRQSERPNSETARAERPAAAREPVASTSGNASPMSVLVAGRDPATGKHVQVLVNALGRDPATGAATASAPREVSAAAPATSAGPLTVLVEGRDPATGKKLVVLVDTAGRDPATNPSTG